MSMGPPVGAAQLNASCATRLSVGGNPDPVALGVFEHPEARTGNPLLGLDDRPPELLGFRQGRSNVLDGDEEQDLVLGGLAGADRNIRAAFGARVDEGVSGERAFLRDLPSEQIGKVSSANLGLERRSQLAPVQKCGVPLSNRGAGRRGVAGRPAPCQAQRGGSSPPMPAATSRP